MSKKQTVALIAVGVFVVIGVIVGILTRSGGETSPVKVGEEGDVANSLLEDESGERLTFTPEVPQGIELTKPVIEAPAAPGSDAKLGIFNMRISQEGFDPSVITVNEGDTVHINLISVGGDYDFFIPAFELYGLAREGQDKFAEFSVIRSGTYVIQCRDYCPSGKIIEGKLIVLP